MHSSSNYIYKSYGGGGASHVGLKSGELSSFSSDYTSKLLIVASGGGGSTDGTDRKRAVGESYFSSGGCGGGVTGAVGEYTAGSDRVGAGGTQTSVIGKKLELSAKEQALEIIQATILVEVEVQAFMAVAAAVTLVEVAVVLVT